MLSTSVHKFSKLNQTVVFSRVSDIRVLNHLMVLQTKHELPKDILILK